jgi:hypothetical protein
MNSRQKGAINQTGTAQGAGVNLSALGRGAVSDVRNDPVTEMFEGGNAGNAAGAPATSNTRSQTHAVSPAPNATASTQPGNPKNPVPSAQSAATDRTPRTGTFVRSGKRRPVSSGDKLRAPRWAIDWARENNLHLHFINDTGGDGEIINEHLDLGYVLVEAPKGEQRFPGTKGIDEASPLGKYVSKVVSKGNGTRAYLMAIPQEEYDELQQAKKNERLAVEQAILNNAGVEGGYSRTESTITIGQGPVPTSRVARPQIRTAPA